MPPTIVCAPLALPRSNELTVTGETSTLVAVLLNPPATTGGARSRNAVMRAADVLGYERAVIANLCAVPTPSVVELNSLGSEGWDLARAELETVLANANALIAGWGVAGLTGAASERMREQVAWLSERAALVGISGFWMVGGEPRHPSRWHQYVSDKHGRTVGGTFEERIAQVLVQVPTMCAAPRQVLTYRQRRSIQVSSSRWSQAD